MEMSQIRVIYPFPAPKFVFENVQRNMENLLLLTSNLI